MSDAELLRVQGSIENLGLTIFGKLDEAERKSEYYNGYETLRKGLSNFDLTLEGDNDWRSYGEKASQEEDRLWQTVDQQVKHQGAKNDLELTWMQMKASHQQHLQDITERVRNRNLNADLVKRIDSRAKEVQIGTMSAAEAQARDAQELKSLSAGPNPVVDPVTAVNTLKAQTRDNQLSEIYRRVAAEAKASGWQKAISDIPAMASGYSEIVSDDIPAIEQRMAQTANILRAQQNIGIRDQNDKIESAIIDKLKDNDLSGALSVLNSAVPTSANGFKDLEGGKSGAEYWQQWHSYLHAFAASDRAQKRAEEADNVYFNQLMLATKTHSMKPDQIITEAISQVSQGHMTWKQEAEIEKASKGEVAAQVNEYLKPFDEGFKDTSLDQNHRNLYGIAEAMFRSYAAGGTRSESDLKARQQELLGNVKNAVAGESIDKIFGTFVPTRTGPPPITAPMGGIYGTEPGKPESKIPKPTNMKEAEDFVNRYGPSIKKLPSSSMGFSIKETGVGFRLNGVDYVLASDGNWYTR